MFVTATPCEYCAQRILNTGIAKVIFGTQYRDQLGATLLQDAGVELVYSNPIEVLKDLHSWASLMIDQVHRANAAKMTVAELQENWEKMLASDLSRATLLP